MNVDPKKVFDNVRKNRNPLVKIIQDRAMKRSKRKYLFSVPYVLSIDMNNHHHILINANDAGEALRKAKECLEGRHKGVRTVDGKVKKKLKFVWGKPEKLRSNPKYKG